MKKSGNPSLLKICLLAVMFLSYTDTYVLAAPKGGHTVSGTASFTQDGNLTVITAGNRSIINYQSFNIAPGETVRFVQPNSNSSVLNRVTGPNPTNIFGQLQANGNVFIVNPYGVFFQNGAVLNVGGLYAGAGKINDQDFTRGRIKFTDLAGDVRNDGVLAADNRIVLMGANVTNTGTMTSTRGLATMVSGKEVYVGERNSNVFVQANGKPGQTARAASASSGSVTNTGTVSAPRVLLGAGDLYSTAIVNSGLLKGRDITVNAGRNGSATVGGTLDATGRGRGALAGQGGNIQVLGGNVALKGATLDASGTAGGGSVRVGGDFHGAGTLARATTTSVDAATTIKADATGAQGNGGTVVVWSDNATSYAGNISARGGTEGGDGGQAEVSGKGWLGYTGLTDLRATAGRTGTLLLDPYDVEITAGNTTNNGPVGTTFYPTGAPSTIQNTDLQTALGLANITVTTTPLLGGGPNTQGTITVSAPVTWGGNTLTLQADKGIVINAGLTSSNVGGLVLTASGGSITQSAAISVGTLSGSSSTDTVLNNTGNVIGTLGNFAATGGFTLVNNAALTVNGTVSAGGGLSVTTATGGLTVSGGSITSGTVTAGSSLALNSAAGITHTAGTISAGTGTLSLQAVGTITESGTGTLTAGTLTGQAGGNTTLNGAVGTLGAFTVTGSGGTFSLTDTVGLTVSGPLTTGDAVGPVLGGNITLSSPNLAIGGAVTATTNGVGTGAVINLNGTTTLSIGGAVSGGSLTTGVGTATFNTGGGVTTFNAGGQTYSGPVVIAADTTLTANTAPINFTSTIDGVTGAARSLTLSTSGTQTFGGAVGGTVASNTPLSSLTTGTGQTTIAGPTITTTGIQQYGGAVLLGGAAALKTTNSAVTANSINNAGFTLGINAGTGNVTLGGTGADHSLTVLTGSGADNFTAGILTLNGVVASAASLSATTSTNTTLYNNVTTTGTQSYNAVLLGAAATLATTNSAVTANSINNSSFALGINAGTGNITVGGTGADHSLTVLTGTGADTFTAGVLAINGVVASAASLSATTSGNTTLFNNVTTTGTQTYNAVLLGGGATLTTTNSDITADSINNSSNALTVSTGTGNVTLGGANHALTVLTGSGTDIFTTNILTLNGVVASAGSLTATTADHTTLFNNVTSTGTQSYGAVLLGAAATLATTNSAVTANSINNSSFALGINAGTGNVTIGGTGADHSLTVLTGTGGDTFTAGTLTLNGVVSAASLSATTSTNTTLFNNVTTTGTQSYNAVLLGAAATLATTNSALTADSINTSGFALTVSVGTGAVTLGGTGANHSLTVLTGNGADIFNAASLTLNGLVSAASLTANTTGNTTLYNNVTTTGFQSYNGFALGADAILSGTTFSATSFAGNNHDLTLTFSSAVNISGFFGGVKNLTSNGMGGTNLSGTVATTGFQLYSNIVTLGSDVLLTSSGPGGGDVTFGSTLNSDATARSLTINTTGNEIFNGVVGGTSALSGLTTDSDAVIGIGGQTRFSFDAAGAGQGVNVTGDVQINDSVLFNVANSNSATTPTVRTTGSQVYSRYNNQLGADTYLLASGDITIGSTVAPATGNNRALDNATAANPHALTLRPSGATVIRGLVGDLNRVGSLEVNPSSTGVTISGDAALGLGYIRTTGQQNYYVPVTLANDITFSSTAPGSSAGGIYFGSTFSSDSALTRRNLTTDTQGGNTVFGFNSGTGAVTLNNLTTSAQGTTQIGFSSLTTAGAQNYQGATLAQVANLSLTAGTTIRFGGAVTTDQSNPSTNLTTSAVGGVGVAGTTFVSTVGTTLLPFQSVTVTGTSSIGNSIFTVNDQTYGGNATLAGTATLASTSGSIFFNGTLAAATAGVPALTIDLTDAAQSINFANTVGGGGNTLASLNVLRGITNITGPVGAGAISTTGNQNYGGAVVATVPVTFSATTGSATFGGALSSTGAITITAGGGIAVNGGSVSSAGGQTYNSATTIGGTASTLLSDTGAGNVNFVSTLNSATATQRDLTINTSGDEIFGGLVGGQNKLLSLTTDAAGVVGGGTHFNMTVSGAGVAGVDVGTGGVTLNDRAFFNVTGSSSTAVPPELAVGTTDNPSVRTTGAQQYLFAALPAQLQKDTVLQGTALTLAGGVNGLFGGANYNLTLNFSSTASPVVVSGGVFTGINGFASVGAGGTQVSGNFQTTGYQFYGNTTTLTGATALSSTGNLSTGTIRFDGLLDGPFTLAIDTAGNEVFNNLVGSRTGGTLTGLTIDGNIVPGGMTIFGMDLTGQPNGTAGVRVGAGGVVVNDDVAFRVVGSVQGSGPTPFTLPSVLSGGVQTYNGIATLGQGTVLTNTNGGTIRFAQTINGTQDLVLNSSGDESFGGLIGNLNPLLSLTTDADVLYRGGTARFNVVGGVGVTTVNNVASPGAATGAQTYNDAVLISQNATFSSAAAGGAVTAGGAITFNGTVDSTPAGNNLTVLAGPGQTVFGTGATTINAAALDISGAQVVFNQPVGATGALGILTVGRNGNLPGVIPSIDINNGGFTSTAATGQLYRDAVVLSANTLLTANLGNIEFRQTVDSETGNPTGPFTLTLNSVAGQILFGINSLVGNTRQLSGLTATSALGTVFNANLNGTQSAVTAGAGGITITGPAIFNGTGSSLTSLAGSTFRSGGAITFNGAVTLNQDLSLYGTGGNDIVFNGAVDGPAARNRGLALNTAGNEIFNAGAIVGGTNPLLSFTADTLIAAGGQTRFLMNAAGTPGVRIGAGGLQINDGVIFGVTNASLTRPSVLVYDTGYQIYNGAAVVSQNTFIVGDNSGGVPAPGVYTGGNFILFNQSVTGTTGAQNLSLYTGQNVATLRGNINVGALSVGGAFVTFEGPVSNLAQVSIVPNEFTGNINIAASTITTSGAQSYNAPVGLTNNATLNAGTNVFFASTIQSSANGPYSLAVNATNGNITFSDQVGSVGGGSSLTSLTTTGGGTTFILSPAGTTGGVITTGFQSYGTTNGTQIGTVATLTAGTDISFLTSLNGTPAAANTSLTLAASNQILFGGPVGGTTPLTLLSATAPTIRVNGGLVTTNGAQTYAGSVLLGNTALLTSLNNGDVTFSGTINGAFGLTVNTGGNTLFNGFVGGSDALASLTTDGPGATFLNGGGVTTTGAQTYGDAVTLGAATTLTGASVGFTLTLDGPYDLAVNAGGNTIFGGAVGGNVALTSLTTDAGGTTFLNGGSVTTTGAQSYGDGVLLGADTILAGGSVNFGQTLDGTFDLSVATAGNTVFGGLVGGVAALGSLTTDAGGTTLINGGGVTTTGGQDYGDAVVLGNTASLNAAAVIFRQTLDGNFDLTLNVAGATVLGGLVGGSDALASLTTDGPGQTLINGGGVTTTGAQTYGDGVLLGADTALNGSSVGFVQTLDGAFNLAVNAGGDTTFGGFVGGNAALASLTTDAGGTTFVNGGGVITTGAQRYGDMVILGANAILNGLSVTFDQTLDGGGGLVINTGGDATFNGLVGTGTPLLNLTVNTGGTTFLNGGGVRTLGFQTYNNRVMLGPVAVMTSVNTAGDGGAISFVSTVDGASALTVNTSGNTVFNQVVGGITPLLSLTTDAGGATFLRGGSVTTSGAQSYGDAVGLGANTTLTGSGVAFGSTLDGTYTLQIQAGGSTIFGGLVGNGGALTQLTINSANNPGADVQFNMTLDGTARAGVLVNGAVAAYGPVSFNASGSNLAQPTVLTYGDKGTQSYNGAVTVAANTVLVSAAELPGGLGDPFAGGRSIAFSAGISSAGGGAGLLVRAAVGSVLLPGTVDADNVDIGGAAVTFGGDVTLGGQFSVQPNDGEGGGIIQFNGGSVQTRNGQTFNAPVSLGADTTFATSEGGAVTFNSDLDGPFALTIDTGGNTTIQGAVGAGMVLGSVHITGTASINGGLVRTSGEQLYEGDLTLAPGNGGTTILRANDGNLLFYGDVTAPQSGLFVQGNRIAVRGDMVTGGDLDLETQDSDQGTPILVLEGANYRSEGGNVYFNRSGFGTSDNRATATIILTNTARTNIRAAGNFEVGYLQKVFSFGALSITANRAVVGDLAARDTLRISASEVDLLARPAGNVATGGTNTGLNIVAVSGIDFGGAKIVFNTQNDSNATASFITANNNVNIQRVQGISLFRNPGLDSASFSKPISDFQQVVNNKAVTSATLREIETFPIQPIGGGILSLDTAAALSGALPDQKPVDVAAEITITASQMEELKKLGIHPRLAQKSERRSSGSKRALFAQLVDGQDPENYGRLQPIKGGISRLEPSDYVVVVDRMGEREVSSILKSFEQVYGKNKEKAPEIGAAFQTAFTDYTVQKQTADPAGFGPFLEKSKGKYPAVNKATRDFDELFGHIEHLGLTDKEVFKSQEHIVSDLGVSGVSSADMVKVINGLRKKLPPEQRAATTKGPQSVPAANPAPGASSPAGTPAPAQPPKKKSPPLKTAEREQQGAPVKSARRSPVREGVRSELAGL